MDVAAGDRLITPFRPRRSRSELAFLTVWLTGWTFGGLAAAEEVPNAGPGGGAFLAFWMCGWFLGECFVIGAIAWQLFGRGTFVVTRDDVVLRKQIGPLARTVTYDAQRVDRIDVVPVPHDPEDEEPRPDFCVRVTFDDSTLHAGEGMKEHEAEHVAAMALARIRQRSWWGDDAPATSDLEPRAGVTTLSFRDIQFEQPAPRTCAVVAAMLVACAVSTGTVVGLAFADSHDDRTTQTAPTPAQPTVQRPTRGDFHDAAEYAAAMTRYVLRSTRTVVLGAPRCNATWAQWSCSVRARSNLPPFAGRSLTYRCRSVTTGGVVCGPKRRSLQG